MSERRPHEFEIIRDEIWAELRADTAVLAKELIDGLPDAKDVHRPEFIRRAQRQWSDPFFRAVFYDQWAPKGLDGQRDPIGIKRINDFYDEHIAPAVLTGAIVPQPVPPPDPVMGMVAGDEAVPAL